MIRKILNGWANLVKDKFLSLDPETKTEAEKRLKICTTCTVRKYNYCHPLRRIKHKKTGNIVRGCGCYLSAKTLSMESNCPAGKW